uniref:Uncharacterized protein n=1 Tax=Rhizophora mucronata TaxID=61149 RepID=A0A2P2NJA6_RHIMU
MSHQTTQIQSYEQGNLQILFLTIIVQKDKLLRRS